MKILVEVDVVKNYGSLDVEALNEIRDLIDEEWPNYLTVTNSEGEEVSLEILHVRSVSIEDEGD